MVFVDLRDFESVAELASSKRYWELFSFVHQERSKYQVILPSKELLSVSPTMAFSLKLYKSSLPGPIYDFSDPKFTDDEVIGFAFLLSNSRYNIPIDKFGVFFELARLYLPLFIDELMVEVDRYLRIDYYHPKDWSSFQYITLARLRISFYRARIIPSYIYKKWYFRAIYRRPALMYEYSGQLTPNLQELIDENLGSTEILARIVHAWERGWVEELESLEC